MTATNPPRPNPDTAAAAGQDAVSALAGYLDSVAAELAGRGIPLLDSQVQARPLLSGRIRLARQRHRRGVGRCRVVLTWAEDQGWAAMLHPPGRGVDEPALPWRFLHLDLVVDPATVANFTAALLRGDELGMPYPAQFRHRGAYLPAVITKLIEHTSVPEAAPTRSKHAEPAAGDSRHPQ